MTREEDAYAGFVFYNRYEITVAYAPAPHLYLYLSAASCYTKSRKEIVRFVVVSEHIERA